jgi:hypothetical protein
VARKLGGKLEPRAASEAAHTRNIADRARGVFYEAPCFCIVHDQADHESASRYENEHVRLKQATGASLIIVRTVSAEQRRAISKEVDIF